MKEIFSKEFKEFMEKNKQNKSVCMAKSIAFQLKVDPRWAPEILKDCPNQVEKSGSKYCDFDRTGEEVEPCDGTDKCNVLKSER